MSTSPRHARLESTLHREIQRVLSQGLNDPRLDGILVTVMGVSVDEPGTTAIVRVALRPDKKKGLAALTQASSHIARQARQRVSIRRMPKLLFREDRGLRKETEVLAALADARDERGDETAQDANDTRIDGPTSAPGAEETET
jgi:ribosome-binding factor A